MKIITRAEAKAQGLPRYYTGKPCKHGHVSERYAFGGCVACMVMHKSTPEYLAASRAYANRRRAADPERARAEFSKYYAENREYHLQRRKQHRLDRPDLRKACKARRRARLAAAMPASFGEFDVFVITEAYRAAARRSKMHGEAFHVDHVIPLARGGAHAWHNIQVIPARLNQHKLHRLMYTRPGEWIRDA